MDESGNHHSQQTDTRTENQTPHILTHRRVLNDENTWIQGGKQHTLEHVSVSGGDGEHHPQQTDTRTENQTPHILTHRWELNNENTWTQGGEHHTIWSLW